MVIVPVIAAAVALVAVNAGTLVAPLATNPILILEFVHVNVAPAGALVNVFRGTVAPVQNVRLATAVTVVNGVTVTVETAEFVQAAVVPVTV